MYHFAFDGVRSTQNGVGILDSAVSQQVAHIGGAPGAHCLGLVLLAPCAALGLGGIGQRVDGLSPFARGFRLEIARNAHFTRATVIDHVKFEYTGGGGKIGDMLHITFSPLAHGGILPEDQRTHAQLAGESAKEENV